MFDSRSPQSQGDGDNLSAQRTPQTYHRTFHTFSEYPSQPTSDKSDNLGGLFIPTLHPDHIMPIFLDLVERLHDDKELTYPDNQVRIYLGLFNPNTRVETKYRNISLDKSVVTSYLSESFHQLLFVNPSYADLSVCAMKEGDSREVRICRDNSILLFCEAPVRRGLFERVFQNYGFTNLPTNSPNELRQELPSQETQAQIPRQVLQRCFTQMIRDLGLEEMNSGGDSQE
jgi:hypothetical protein